MGSSLKELRSLQPFLTALFPHIQISFLSIENILCMGQKREREKDIHKGTAERLLSHSSICKEYFVLSPVALETLCQPEGLVTTSAVTSLTKPQKCNVFGHCRQPNEPAVALPCPLLSSQDDWMTESSLLFGSHLPLLQSI